MKSADTASRLRELMDARGLKQVDILTLAKPYSHKYGVKLSKSDLSQYVSGKVAPGSDKLTILGLALNVSETWLMGYDVPMERQKPAMRSPEQQFSLSPEEVSLITKYRALPPAVQDIVSEMVDREYEKISPASDNISNVG